MTGCGLISNIGDNTAEFWENLCQGNLGYGPVSYIDTSKYNVHIGGEIREFSPEKYIPRFDEKKNFLGRTSQLALSAAYLAIADAGIPYESLSESITGTAVGTTDGESRSIEKMNLYFAGVDSEIDNDACRLTATQRITYSIAREFQISGPACSIASACTASNHAVAYAYEKIMAGKAEIMIVGGADSFSRKTFTGFNRLGATTPDYCAPFSYARNGMVVSEGAAIIILESLERARKRNARIYAEVAGYGVSCDAFHMTRLSEPGISLAMRNALAHAGIEPDEINIICAHGTGTQANDFFEAKAINAIYGNKTPVTANKSVVGHTMGAASALNVITIALAMRHNKMPRISNTEIVDPELNINCVLRNIDAPILYGQSNGFAFGGNNGVVILKNINLQKE
jgi:3-oxoacyl-[acyl-carrier-protein] synthase II